MIAVAWNRRPVEARVGKSPSRRQIDKRSGQIEGTSSTYCVLCRGRYVVSGVLGIKGLSAEMVNAIDPFNENTSLSQKAILKVTESEAASVRLRARKGFQTRAERSFVSFLYY